MKAPFDIQPARAISKRINSLESELKRAQSELRRSRNNGAANGWGLEPEAQPVREEAWFISYLDVMTLLLVAMIVMLAFSGTFDTSKFTGKLVTTAIEPEPEPKKLDTANIDPANKSPILLADRHITIDEPEIPLPSSYFLALALTNPDSDPVWQRAHEQALEAQFGLIAPPSHTDTSNTVVTKTNEEVEKIIAGSIQTIPLTSAEKQFLGIPEQAQSAGESLAAELSLGELGKDVEVVVNERSVSFRINSEILFPTGQAELSKAGLEVLHNTAKVLVREGFDITVEGHTDTVPLRSRSIYPSNWELSSARAGSVVRYLIANGIDKRRLKAVGYADTRPIAANAEASGRAQNRRVELMIEKRDPTETID